MQIRDETVSHREGEDLWGEGGLASFQPGSGKRSLSTSRSKSALVPEHLRPSVTFWQGRQTDGL